MTRHGEPRRHVADRRRGPRRGGHPTHDRRPAREHYHGEPRATQDIDIVIEPASRDALDRFAAALDRDRFYVGDHRAALTRREPFNAVDTSTGWKVDLILRRDRPYSRAEFGRRQAARIEAVPVYIASAEDTILSKLERATLGESERQLRDVRAVVAAAGGSLDHDYLNEWAAHSA